MAEPKDQIPPKPSTTPDAVQSPAAVGVCPKHATQEKKNSCVIASSRNIIKQLTGKDVPESQLRDDMNNIIGEPDHDWDKKGTKPGNAVKLLEDNGVKAKRLRGDKVSNDDLAALTAKGKPVMVGFEKPAHRVILDSVTTDQDGKKTYNVRDPAGKYKGEMRKMSEEDFTVKRSKKAAVIVPE